MLKRQMFLTPRYVDTFGIDLRRLDLLNICLGEWYYWYD